MQPKKESKKTKDFSPEMTFLLFEEPEAFLHPPQQEILARSLRLISQSSDRQVLCSTHSSHFVSKNSNQIPSIIRTKRDSGVSKTLQIKQEEWDLIVNSNQEINRIAKKYPKMKKRLESDDLLEEMESVKYCLWLNPDRCRVSLPIRFYWLKVQLSKL